ncbi:unnamed protein product [Adineta steineri]|uniref:Riboflavin transporter n=1 Tax=Adineta steineri TaxID=433720 RepID=A0A814NX07_9BILA|nr:unnamed protein product [Adineta steineri]
MGSYKIENTTTIVFILITIFSLCQNILFYGIFIELPVIVDRLPEGWSLPATFNLISQTAIISASIIFLLRHLAKSNLYEDITIIITLVIGISAFVLLVFTWNKTTLIDNEYHSTYFLFFTFIICSCDYTGTLLFLPYIHRYESIMMRAYFLGDSISSGSLAILGYTQDSAVSECILITDGNQTKAIEEISVLNYSIETYFSILSCIILFSLISFLILSISKIGQDKINENDETLTLIDVNNQENQKSNRQFHLSDNAPYLFAMFWSCLITFGFLPALQTYALSSYSQDIYQKTIVSSEVVYVLVQIMCAVYSNITVAAYPRLIHILNIIATILVMCILIIAKMSPCPPFIDHILIGGLVTGLIYLTANGINHFTYIILNIHFRDVAGKAGLFWGCVMVQSGTFLGASFGYIFTVHFSFFKERFPCVDYIC